MQKKHSGKMGAIALPVALIAAAVGVLLWMLTGAQGYRAADWTDTDGQRYYRNLVTHQAFAADVDWDGSDGAELDKVEPLANAREPGLARDDGADTGILAGDEVGDLLVRAAVVVGAGKVGKEGAQVGDAEFGERLGARFAHALDIADIGVERRHAEDPLYKCGIYLL